MNKVDEELQFFRKRWLEAKEKGDTAGMRIIEIRAKLLKKSGDSPELDLKEVEEIFGVPT